MMTQIKKKTTSTHLSKTTFSNGTQYLKMIEIHWNKMTMEQNNTSYKSICIYKCAHIVHHFSSTFSSCSCSFFLFFFFLSFFLEILRHTCELDFQFCITITLSLAYAVGVATSVLFCFFVFAFMLRIHKHMYVVELNLFYCNNLQKPN